MPSERATRKECDVTPVSDSGAIEIEFSGGPSLKIRGFVDPTTLLQILTAV